jgi:transcriptional regulator with XRE-family HTH domain
MAAMTSEVMAFRQSRRYRRGVASVDSRVTSSASPVVHVGALLREWRAARRLSQLGLALDVGISTRHLSCIETGKAQPSREMLARLADTLGMPLRERNALLVAAGYAPKYPETGLGTPALAQIRRAIDLIVEHQEPYPAFVLNRRWDVLRSNRAAVRVGHFLLGHDPHPNMVRQFFDPQNMRRAVANWEEVASNIIQHLHDAVAAMPSDEKTRALLEEALSYPGVPSQWRTRELSSAPAPLLTVVMRKDERELRFFSTITTFGTPRDVTLDEIHIECVFPADEATAEMCRNLASEARRGRQR